MKKIHILLLATFIISTASLTSCNEYKSFSSATKVSELAGNPFYYQLSKSLLKNMSNFLIEKGLKKTVGKLNLTTPLSSILTTADQISSFKSMLGTAYKIPSKKLDSASFDQVGTMKDLVGFVAKNATHFNFYGSK